MLVFSTRELDTVNQSQWKANSLQKFPESRDTRHIWNVWELKLLRYCHSRGLWSCPNTQCEHFEKRKTSCRETPLLSSFLMLNQPAQLPSSPHFWEELLAHRTTGPFLSDVHEEALELLFALSLLFFLFCISSMRDNSDCRSNGYHSQKNSWH